MTATSARADGPAVIYQGATFRRASRSILALLVGTILIAGFAGGAKVSVSTIAAPAFFYFCGAVIWEARLRRMGLRIEPERVVAVYAIRSRHYAIDQVAGFSLRYHGSSGGMRCVYVELVNGKRHVVNSLNVVDWGPFKTDAIRWATGQTTVVVAYLDDQLRRAQAAQRAGDLPRYQG